MDNPDNNDPHRTNYDDAITLGLSIAFGMIFFLWLGHWLDKKQGGYFWTIVGFLLGLFYCGYELWKMIRKIK